MAPSALLPRPDRLAPASAGDRADPGARYRRLRAALADEPLPAALCDLDAFDENVDQVVAAVRAAGRRLRVATKSLRCPALVERVVERGGATVAGLLGYTAAESVFWAGRGAGDVLLAYPTLHPADLALLAQANREAEAISVVVDCEQHVEALARAAQAAGARVPTVIDVDLGYRPLPGVHLGVRRSPLRTPAAVAALAERVAAAPGLVFRGLLGYEAHIAGLTDENPFTAGSNLLKRLLKRRARPDVARRRRALVEALGERGLRPGLFNGGGSGSLGFSLADPSLTEVSVGSAFGGSLLFDYYRGLSLAPALCFALQVTRCPGPGLVTCHGGGLVASGEAGADRLPRPWLPPGLELLSIEGAGEVQTPLRARGTSAPRLGEPVFFRHAKAGELAEHFNTYLVVQGDRVVERVPTYRGLSRCFLG